MCLWVDIHVGFMFAVTLVAIERVRWGPYRVEIIHQPKNGLLGKLGAKLSRLIIGLQPKFRY